VNSADTAPAALLHTAVCYYTAFAAKQTPDAARKRCEELVKTVLVPVIASAKGIPADTIQFGKTKARHSCCTGSFFVHFSCSLFQYCSAVRSFTYIRDASACCCISHTYIHIVTSFCIREIATFQWNSVINADSVWCAMVRLCCCCYRCFCARMPTMHWRCCAADD
jgi:hypothetical protein